MLGLHLEGFASREDEPEPEMDFEVNVDEHADAYAVISVHGEIDLHTAPKVQRAVERGAGNGAEVVIVDMSNIEFMDSTALSTFIRLKNTLEERDVALRLASPSGAVERIFSVTGFGDYFDIFSSREAAIASG